MYWLVPIGLPVVVSLVTSVRKMAAMPKSSTFTVPSPVDEDVVRLEVAVDDGYGVRVGEDGAICAPVAAAHSTGSGSAGLTK